MARSHYETIVIGLGAAGVTAATTLAKAGRIVLGIEAEGRVGGRVNTVPFGDGVVELGAEWIHGESSNRVHDVALQTKIPMKFQSTELNIFRSDGHLPNEQLQGIINEILAKGMDFMENMPEKSEPFGIYAVKKLREYIKENHPELLEDEDLIDQLIELLELLSNNHSACNNWNDLDSRDRYTPVDGHQYISWHNHGFKTFFEVMLNTYNNGPGLSTFDIKLNTEVVRISWPEDHNEKVTVTTKDGAVVTADNVIITVSLGVLKESARKKPPRYDVLYMSLHHDGKHVSYFSKAASNYWPQYYRHRSDKQKNLSQGTTICMCKELQELEYTKKED